MGETTVLACETFTSCFCTFYVRAEPNGQAFVSRKRDCDCCISWDAFLKFSPHLKSVAFGSTQEVFIEGHCDFLLFNCFFRFFRVMVYGCVKVSSYFPGVSFLITFLFCQYLCYDNDMNIILMLLGCSFEFKKCSFV